MYKLTYFSIFREAVFFFIKKTRSSDNGGFDCISVCANGSEEVAANIFGLVVLSSLYTFSFSFK